MVWWCVRRDEVLIVLGDLHSQMQLVTNEARFAHIGYANHQTKTSHSEQHVVRLEVTAASNSESSRSTYWPMTICD